MLGLPSLLPRGRAGRAFQLAVVVLSALFLVALLALSLTGRSAALDPNGKTAILALAAALFGALTAAAEIVLRYRDEPFLALATMPAQLYLAFNGVVSLTAFALIRRYADQLLPAAAHDLTLAAILGGFGGMAVLRSKLFSYQTEAGNELAAGPALVVDAFLRVLDRRIDRLRSAARERLVFERVHDLFPSGSITLAEFTFTVQFLQAHLLSYLNLRTSEKEEIAGILRSYQTDPELQSWPLTLRMLAVGFAILNVVGETNLTQVFADLKSALDLEAKSRHAT